MSLLLRIREAKTEDHILRLTAEHLADRFDAHCDIYVAGGGGLMMRASTRSPESVGRLRLGRGVGMVGHVASTGEAAAVASDLRLDPRWHEPSPLDDDFESAVCVPIRIGAEGCICVLRRSEWWTAESDLDRIAVYAGEATAAIELFRSGVELGNSSSRLSAVTEVTSSISTSPYLEEILQLLVNMTAQRFRYKVVTVRLLDEKRQELILRATQATNKAYQNKRAIHYGESIAGKVLKTGKAIIVRDVQTDPEYVGHDLARDQGLRSMVCLPLAIQEKSVGVLTCYTGESREFPQDELAALEALAKQAALSIEHAKLQVRSTLMQEMHHRVKNNLQQVASLLRLQIRQSHYKDPGQALSDSLARILAIASVHELLSREDLDHVGMRELAETLGAHVQQSVMMPGKSIRFSIRGDNVYLNINQATQVALIMNEMIQNAVEHGFQETDDGEIHVTIEEADEAIGLWVSNDGDPLPAGFDQTSGRLGLQIIHSLARALGGSFKLENRLGWTVGEVKFTRARAE